MIPDKNGTGRKGVLFRRFARTVLPEFFGKGCGGRIFDHALHRLHAQGYEQVYLWVLEENLRARAFYERSGFLPNGDTLIQTVGGRKLTELRYVRIGTGETPACAENGAAR